MPDDLSLALGIAALLAVAGLAGAAASMSVEIKALHKKLMDSWQERASLMRTLETEQAARRLDREAYDRRVKRWCAYATELQDVCISLGTLAPWKAQADRKEVPFVDSDAAPL